MDFLVPKVALQVFFTKKRIQGHLISICLGTSWDNHNGSLNLFAKKYAKISSPNLTSSIGDKIRHRCSSQDLCWWSYFQLLCFLRIVNSLLQYRRIQVKQVKGQQLHKFRSKKTTERSKLCQSLKAESEEITYKTGTCSSMYISTQNALFDWWKRVISLAQKLLI